jgi:hypothetical protein
MTHRKIAASLGSTALPTLRRVIAGPAMLACAILAVACSGRTYSEHVGTAPSSNSDTISADDAGGPVDRDDRGLYRPCIGNNDGKRGSCDEGEVCGSMPYVGYSYCMPSVPCAAEMAPVFNLACAYPCDDASACFEHGLARCARNTLSAFGARPAGWCTP